MCLWSSRPIYPTVYSQFFFWIAEGHLNVACTKVNLGSCNPDSLSGFSISVKCACIHLKDQELFLTALSPLPPTESMSCQCQIRNFSLLFTALCLHYHQFTQPMGISYLDSYGNFSRGLAAHFLFPLSSFFFALQPQSHFLKTKADHIVGCHHQFETTQRLSVAQEEEG